jgi:aspartate/methionine/tyrosine aminotransferase
LRIDTKSHIAKRMQGIHSEAAFEVFARATALERQGRSIVHLEIGEPDFDTPEAVVKSAIGWLKKGATHYSPTQGVPELREAIAARLSWRHKVQVDAQNIHVSPGTKMMIFACIQAVVDPGDEVISVDPGYPAYEAAVRMAGGVPVLVPAEESNQFRFTVDDLKRRITDRTKLIIINSPQNPTGGVLTLKDLTGVAELAHEHDLLILSDEIYGKIFYEQRPASMLDVPGILDRLMLVNGYSKAWAMTGWRLGFGLIPREVFPAVDLFLNTSVSATATFTQRAALDAAFLPETEAAIDKMVAEFKKRRDVFVDGLNNIPGIRCLKPLGAFYLFPNISALGKSSREIADRLLTEAGVAGLPGTSFGSNGEGFMRFSFANSLSNIEAALERIHTFVSSL